MFYPLIIFLLCLFRFAETNPKQTLKPVFPKKLWIYWNSNPENAPTFTRLCMNNMRHYTSISGWQFTIFDNESVFKYISPENGEKLNFLKHQIKNITPQALSDLHRLFVLYDNGGMWLDANSFFVRDFSWVDNIHKQETVYNKVVDDPDLVMFTYDWFFAANRTVVYDEELQFNVRVFPATEYWSFLAKPKAKFLEDIIQRMVYTFKKPTLQEYYEQNERLGYTYREQIDPYYVYSIYQLQTQLQFIQREIENNPKNFDVKYAVQYYKIWNIDALQTAYLLFQVNQWEIQSTMMMLFSKNVSQFTSKFGKKVYFIKFSASYYPFVNSILNTSVKAICLHSIQPFPSYSIANEFLFKYSPHEPTVVKHLQLQGKRDRNESIQCEDVLSSIDTFFADLAMKVCFGLFLVTLFLQCCFEAIKCGLKGLYQTVIDSKTTEFKKLGQSEPAQSIDKLGQI